MKKIIIILLVVLMILIGYMTINNLLTSKDTIDTRTIEHSIRGMAELTVIRYDYKDVIIIEDQIDDVLLKALLGDLGEKTAILSYSGYIEASIDMERVDVSVEEDTIVVTVPEPSVTANVISNRECVHADDSIFNKWELGEDETYFASLKKEKEEFFINSNYLINAKNNTVNILKNFLTSLGHQKVEIEFKK